MADVPQLSALQAHAARLTALAERYEGLARELHERHATLVAFEAEHPTDFGAHARAVADVNAWWQAEQRAIMAEFADLFPKGESDATSAS